MFVYDSCFAENVKPHRTNTCHLSLKTLPKLAFASVKRRRNLAVLKRFVVAAVSRRKLRVQARISAAVKLQKAWRRYTLHIILDRVVLATAATEVRLAETMRISDTVGSVANTHVNALPCLQMESYL